MTAVPQTDTDLIRCERDTLRDALDELAAACALTFYDVAMSERWVRRDAALKRAQAVLKATETHHAA